MSVEEAKWVIAIIPPQMVASVTAAGCDHFTIIDPQALGATMSDALDRLILEVQAEMPCYRIPHMFRAICPTEKDWLAWQPCFDERVREEDDDFRCPPCAARAALKVRA